MKKVMISMVLVLTIALMTVACGKSQENGEAKTGSDSEKSFKQTTEDVIKKSPETSYIWPIKNKIYPSREDVVAGDDTAGFISSRFSNVKIHRGIDRFDNDKFHRGIDIAFKDGTPVYSAASGTVVFAGCGDSKCGEECEDKCNKKYGKYIIISHPDGMVTLYAHLQEFKISNGDNVKQGELIGLVGHTGFVTGPHLHFEIRKDSTPVDPMLYLPKLEEKDAKKEKTEE